jgi:uridine kinase
MQDSFYKTLDEEGSRKAFRNEYDFDHPDAIDFDVLVDRLRELKAGYVTFFISFSQPCVD